MKNNLSGLIDQTYPGANTYFDSSAREDESQKWVNFLDTYWHVDRVRIMSLNSGDYSQKSVHASKHGSPILRKTLFLVMDALIKTKPDDPVYLFMDTCVTENTSPDSPNETGICLEGRHQQFFRLYSA